MGWIKIDRQLFEHWLWEDKPFSKGQAWIDLIGLANYEDGKTPYKGKVIICRRGTVNRSISFLAKRWGWSRDKTRDFLNLLQSDNMIHVKATTHQTTITLENYGKFQDSVTTNPTTNRQQTSQPTDSKPYKEIRRMKKNKEGEEIYSTSAQFVCPTLSEVKSYCQSRGNQIDPEEFVDYYKRQDWKLANGLSMKDWKAAVRGWEKRQQSSNKYDNHPDQRKHYGELDKEIFGDEWG